MTYHCTATARRIDGWWMVQQARSDIDIAGQKRRKVARKLAEDGLTVRDIGAVFGVSYQRAHQLVSD